jgi:hypothetical protein
MSQVNIFQINIGQESSYLCANDGESPYPKPTYPISL